MDDIFERYGLPADADLGDPRVQLHMRYVERRLLREKLVEGVHTKPRRKKPNSTADRTKIQRDAADERAVQKDNRLFATYMGTTLDDLGINSVEAANRTGVSAETIRNYLRGRFLPKDHSFQLLRSGLSLEYGSLEDVLGYMRTR
ncbi:hypothetical protein HOD38_04545 [archaeon]|jgi:hypothetical protein|nr:hypothetical protein [archaeon]MBT4397511.1 hypothetical protein [archaeon]MBT4440857.1 hypothetical protein [archaeon]